MDLRETLNLPDPEFTIPMRAGLGDLEPKIQAIWKHRGLYHLLQESRKDAPAFVLHDGPPYTNSPIHIGTALNKILKDFVLKSRAMMGYRTPYVPGFDNHGLPIEQTVAKRFEEEKVTPDLAMLRQACREHAAQFIEVQTEQFQRLGVLGLWEKPYTTMNFRFEAEIVRVFKRLAEKGYIYRGLRPTLWSPTSRTALADTEIVYKDHTSTQMYVRFPLLRDHNGFSKGLPNFSTIIWTTTPWTIPANLGVAFHPMLEYAVVRVGEEHYLVLASLVEKLAATLGWGEYEVVLRELGISFEGSAFKHPLLDRESIAVMAEYVTTDDGTGVVHTAPGHGRDDFYTGQKYGLPALCPVDERGVMTEEAGEFAGLYYAKASAAVETRLRESGNLLFSAPLVHAYPHAERDGQPVIYRATEQWFISIDHDGLRKRMLSEIEAVSWVPASGERRIESMVRGRPDWCISRQRPWGVGIPVFYGKDSGQPVFDPEAMEAVARLVEREGSDAWFKRSPQEILPEGYRHPETGEAEFSKETDVLDVWFDSGSTSLAVLEGGVEPMWKDAWPADLYLEGSDQHRGWFNSSLVIGAALHGHAPYRQVLTHGFVTDEKGHKMSKRLGNVVDPVAAAQNAGADVLRYWVASVDYANDVPCSESLLKQFGDGYRRVRNTLRFLLGNLSDYDGLARPERLEIDRWIMEQVDLLAADCVRKYREYDFGWVIQAIHNFCGAELSAFYLDVIKDRMYCDGKDWDSRRSGQLACHYVLVRLTKLLAPVLAHTAEEVWARIPGVSSAWAEGPDWGSVHLEPFDAPDEAELAAIRGSDFQARFSALLEVRAEVFAAFEKWKEESGLKDTQDVVLRLSGAPEALRAFGSEALALYFKMSWVHLEDGPAAIAFEPSPYPKCDRSRIRRPDVAEAFGAMLTARDRKVLEERGA